MSGESGNHFGNAGDAPAPDSADSAVGDAPAVQPRPFRGWASALEDANKPSLWSRMKVRIATMVSRRAMDAPDRPEAPAAVSAPLDFRFPWTRAAKGSVEDAPILPTNEYPAEAEGESAPARQSWLEGQPPPAGNTFASVEDALPAADAQAVADSPASFQTTRTTPVEAAPGFFARLFRKQEKSKPRRSLEIEIHEDRISAAADALEDVGEQTFAEEQGQETASTDAFASVEEALPGEVTRDDRADVDASSYFGDTLEVVREEPKAPEPAAYLGDTLEIVPVKRDDTGSEAYFGGTLEPGHFGDSTEIEEDTDEYEVVSAPPPASTPSIPAPPLPDLNADTAQVSRKSLLEQLVFWRAKAKAEASALEGATTVTEVGPVFLFSKFRTFYNEIIRSRHQKTEFTAGFSTAIVTEYTADLSPDGAAETLSRNLATMLDLQAAEATWKGGEFAERYPDAQYAMAALADEIFLHSEWEGQGAWHRNLLEFRLFRTHAADVELFRRIDRLLKEQPNSGVARDLARVYLFVIAAGFRGKYRPFGLTRALAEYRQRLFEYIHQGGDALLLYAPERRIFPETAKRTLEGEAVARFTGAQRWAAILVFLAVGYTVIAHVAWSRVSADLKDVTSRIIAGASTTGAR